MVGDMSHHNLLDLNKNSNISWIGKIPSDWNNCRFKDLAIIENGKDYKDVYDVNGDIPVIGSGGAFSRSSCYLYEGPSVLLGRKGTINKPLFVDYPFWTVDTMYYTRIKDGVDPKFLYYYATCFPFDFYQYGSAVPSMTQTDLNSIRLSIPKYDTQCSIASYLDNKCKIVDDMISFQKTLISLFRDLKNSIITEAVTKGLNLNIPMKDSTVQPFVEIPESWKLIKLKYISSERNDILHDTTDPDFEFSYVEISDVSQSEGIHCYKNIKFRDAPSRARKIVKKDDIIISTVRTYLKAIASVNVDNLVVSTGFLVISSTNVDYKFLKYAVLSDYFISCIIERSYGVSYPAITTNGIMNLKIPIPPIEEQIKIANYLDSEICRIDNLIHIIQSEIDELICLKKSIIYECVTGKILLTKEELE